MSTVDQIGFKHEGEDDGMAVGRIFLVDSAAEAQARREAGVSDGPGVPFGFHDSGEHGLVEIWGTRKEANALGRFFGVEVHEA